MERIFSSDFWMRLFLMCFQLFLMRRRTDLHDSLLDERRRVVDQDDEGLRLDELVHHLVQHEVGQQQQDAPQEIIEAAADKHQAVLRTGPEGKQLHLESVFASFFPTSLLNRDVLMNELLVIIN